MSLSKHPSPFLTFTWEQLYVFLSRIEQGNNMILLLAMNNQNTLRYISHLEKDEYMAYYFQGFPIAPNNGPAFWDKDMDTQAAGWF